MYARKPEVLYAQTNDIYLRSLRDSTVAELIGRSVLAYRPRPQPT